MAEKVTPRSEDYAKWYTEVVQRAELADYAPVRGSMVIRPYGYALWENIQRGLDNMFKAIGVQNAYFPLLIPHSFIAKEAEHVAGFAPELVVVTHGGGKELEEPLVIRPTSETVMYSMYAQWIQSWRDLPLKINQWCNVVRWELRTRLFLRTLEFLWQEGHNAFATAEESEEDARRMLGVYQDFIENWTAIPVVAGKKTESQKFPGAVNTYTLEAMMGDRRALQCCTSHNLGQNFSKPFNVQYLDKSNQLQYVWQTSWGLSTRMVGAIVMAHGDDQGLSLPPRLAPTQVVIVPIWKSDAEKAQVLANAQQLVASLGKDLRHRLDNREEYSPGWKFNEWEMRGVPLRIEIGPRDVEKKQVVLVRRDTGEKTTVPQNGLQDKVVALLDEVQSNLYARAKAFLEENSHQLDSYADFKQVIEEKGGFIWAHWCGSSECEAKIKEETTATIRAIPFDHEGESGKCVYDGRPSRGRVVFAKAY
ncbi:MAG: proline--tRNA ligase [Chloroflexi bacterium]|nr:proline--tRNA ligase [Chloroflexota bacterium]